MGTLRKVVGLGLAGIIILALAVGGTLAYLQDQETSTTNRLYAGTLDLTLTPSGSLTNTSLHPGATLGPYTVACANIGSLTGQSLTISFNYTENDNALNPGLNKSAQDVAKVLQVTGLTYNGSSILGSFTNSNGNGWLDLDDLKVQTNSPNSPYNLGLLNSGVSRNFVITLQMRGTADVTDDYRGDGVDIQLNFTLNQ